MAELQGFLLSAEGDNKPTYLKLNKTLDFSRVLKYKKDEAILLVSLYYFVKYCHQRSQLGIFEGAVTPAIVFFS